MIKFTHIFSICLIVIIAQPTGVASSCSPPELPKNSSPVEPTQSNYPENTNIHYKCHSGFSFHDGNTQHKIGCTNGKWYPLKMIECKDKCNNTCSKNGKCQVTFDEHMKEKPFCLCNKNFDGSTCSVPVCDKPSTPEHGSYQLVFGSDRFPVGTKIEYKCDKGYSIKKGTAEATCQQRGNRIDWYPHDARHCEEATCSELFVGSYVKYSPMQSSYKSGTTVTVSCMRGYKLINWHSSSYTFTCKNGIWVPFWRPNCLALTCSPGTVLYGVEVSSGPYPVGTQVKYECNPGYTMVGDSVVNCVDKGTTAGWNEDLPKCLPRCIKQNEKIVYRNGKYSCELQSTLRPLIVYSSKSNSTKPLTIVTATAVGLFLLLLLLITLVAIQRRRLARNGGRCNRSRSRDDRYAFLYYSNDFHLVLPSYDEAIQGRRPQPPPYTSGPANTTSTANTGSNTAAIEPSGTTGIENPLTVSDFDEGESFVRKN